MKLSTRFCIQAVAVCLISHLALGDGILDPKLQQKMTTEAGPFEVIVSFKSISDVNSLSSLGVTYVPLTTLPMSGAILTHDQINAVIAWQSAESENAAMRLGAVEFIEKSWNVDTMMARIKDALKDFSEKNLS